MEKVDRLRQVFNYIKSIGLVHTQKDLAERMKASEATVSKALKGEEQILTSSFLRRLNRAFDNIFNSQWLLTGEGEMLVHHVNQSVNGDNNTQIAGNNNRIALPSTLDRAINEIAEQRKLVSKAQEQIDRLITLLEKK